MVGERPQSRGKGPKSQRTIKLKGNSRFPIKRNPLKGDIPNKCPLYKTVRCIWGWLLRVPSQGYHHFPYDIEFALYIQSLYQPVLTHWKTSSAFAARDVFFVHRTSRWSFTQKEQSTGWWFQPMWAENRVRLDHHTLLHFCHRLKIWKPSWWVTHAWTSDLGYQDKSTQISKAPYGLTSSTPGQIFYHIKFVYDCGNIYIYYI